MISLPLSQGLLVRSIVLTNLSDTNLHFSLSTTFPPGVVRLTTKEHPPQQYLSSSQSKQQPEKVQRHHDDKEQVDGNLRDVLPVRVVAVAGAESFRKRPSSQRHQPESNHRGRSSSGPRSRPAAAVECPFVAFRCQEASRGGRVPMRCVKRGSNSSSRRSSVAAVAYYGR